MPATIITSNNVPGRWNDSCRANSSAELLRGACHDEHKKCIRVTHSSFDDKLFDESNVTASSNGFIYSMLYAYSGHLHVTIRPEDVWFSVLVQFSYFVNAHAEELRSFFVAHKDSKHLKVELGGDFAASDVGVLAQILTEMIQENIVDPDLREWFMPDFSTTTKTDGVVAAVLMMGAMQKYFSYEMKFICGIPSVTLLGEREDWEKILLRLDKLDSFGKEPSEFSRMLKPIIRQFVASFEAPIRPEVLSFWKKVVDKRDEGSGMTYIAGWISAFCFWDSEGKIIKRYSGGAIVEGVEYLSISTTDVTLGFASVPVNIDDNGNEFQAQMVAGSVGITAVATANGTVVPPRHRLWSRLRRLTLTTKDAGAQAQTQLNSIAPLSGWWMYEAKSDAQVAQEERERYGS